MSRHLKLIAAVAVVLVAISGFSPARKGGGRSGGGGCSSSSSSSHSSSDSSYESGSSYGGGSSSYDSGRKDDYGSGDGGYRRSGRYHGTTGTSGTTGTTGTTGTANGTARSGTATGTVAQCAAQSGSAAKAVVEVRNPKSYGKTYQVKVKFLDESGTYVDSGLAEVSVGSRDTEAVDVRMAHPERIGDVSDCLVESVR
ncbi:hypothetical protein [Streptomyces abyssalis]|nr:hypothetical protein [Streptomyces abyssalis]